MHQSTASASINVPKGELVEQAWSNDSSSEEVCRIFCRRRQSKARLMAVRRAYAYQQSIPPWSLTLLSLRNRSCMSSSAASWRRVSRVSRAKRVAPDRSSNSSSFVRRLLTPNSCPVRASSRHHYRRTDSTRATASRRKREVPHRIVGTNGCGFRRCASRFRHQAVQDRVNAGLQTDSPFSADYLAATHCFALCFAKFCGKL